ncbi:DUF429 domain-containing protein [Pontibacter mangrovi]|uniref:DUF429 domain-containing protein n=1 Tax=Pontibacter mangrovi TaxID=2589816 RepID=A0A501W3M9_9BACT|nr:DUF429 domain-containing protein [Pontibacter mangrovi]TPE43235.1 DUF429 domain-containing protein [Pontibacter mangrovi]
MTGSHIGVDFSEKLSGNTAVAMEEDGQLRVWQCERKADADAWLLKLIREKRPKAVFIDAPLTLPKVYTDQAAASPEADFFFRKADREVQAMSPMFLGGMTARAMKLRTQLAAEGVAVLETYPSQACRFLLPQLSGYKKGLEGIDAYAHALQEVSHVKLQQMPTNWHQVDAILCWLSGKRHLNGKSVLYGDATEGRIIV